MYLHNTLLTVIGKDAEMWWITLSHFLEYQMAYLKQISIVHNCEDKRFLRLLLLKDGGRVGRGEEVLH